MILNFATVVAKLEKCLELYKVKKRDLFILLHIDENKLNEELYKYRVCIKDKKKTFRKA